MRKVLTLITARSGSKGLKNKNIKKIDKKTLVEFKNICAVKANIKNNDIYLSTDSTKYINYFSKKKIDCIKRPSKLAKDNTESKPVLIHAIHYLKKKGFYYDDIILLEPATPFTLYKDLKKAYNIFKKKNLDLIASVEKLEFNSIFASEMRNKSLKQMFTKIKKIKKLRRQNFSNEFKMDGGFYIFKISSLLKFKNLFDLRKKAQGFQVHKIRALNIETIFDYNIGQYYYKNFPELKKNFK